MGIYRSQPLKDKKIEKGSNKLFKYTSCQMQGYHFSLGWRKLMQDAKLLYCQQMPYICGVFDGHGGFDVSKFIEKMFVQTFFNCQAYKKNDIQGALKYTFPRLDQMLLQPNYISVIEKIRQENNVSSLQPLQGGSTANIVVFHEKFIYTANVGDTRAVLCRNGQAIALSFDHKPQNEKQKQRITKAGGVIEQGRVDMGLNLSRAIGDLDYKRNQKLKPHQQKIISLPDVTKQQMTLQDEFILIGCDGVWQRYVNNNQEMIDRIRQGLKKEESSQQLIKNLFDQLLAKSTSQQEGIGCDNMTCILIEFNHKNNKN